LINPLDNDYRKEKVGLFLAVHQNTFGRPTLDPADIVSLITKTELISPERKAANLSSGLFYMMSECSSSFDFASFRIAVQMKDLTIKTGLLINEGIKVIDKAEWESFWRVYNLVQEFIIQPEVEVYEPSLSSTDFSFLAYFDQDLLEIVKELDFRKIPFEKDGSYFLEEEGFPSAEAALGFTERRIFLKPVSEQDREVFLNAGYKEVQVEDFKIEMVL
jgi:DEAD/DEAH box helicase domain-containing protein